VIWWLDHHGFNGNDEALVERVFAAAKAADHLLSDDELRLAATAHV
jgi:hypothetical protein